MATIKFTYPLFTFQSCQTSTELTVVAFLNRNRVSKDIDIVVVVILGIAIIQKNMFPRSII